MSAESTAVVLTIIGMIELRSLFAAKLARWDVGAPAAMVAAGAAVAVFGPEEFGKVGTDTVFVQHAASSWWGQVGVRCCTASLH